MHLVENSENLGFAKNCNKGIGLARGDYICLLNNDTKVKSNFVKRNVEILDADSSIGILSCIVVDERGKNWFSGGNFKSGLSENLVDDFEGVRTVDWVAGTACFLRKEVFERAGLLEEGFYMYHEDIEFCLRVTSKTAYRACMFSDKLVIHYIGASLGCEGLYYIHRNYILVLKRYCPKYIPKVLLLRYLSEVVLLAIIYTKARRPREFLIRIRPILRGIKDGLISDADRQPKAARNSP
jgi:hypothetical protein